jgi:hypothetical protein
MSCRHRAAMAGEGANAFQESPPLFRSGWEIAAMVGGFIAFVPLGLGILGYLIWRKKMGDGDTGPAGMKSEFKRWKHEMKAHWKGRGGFGGGPFRQGSGNMAFDDYRAAVLQRLEEERRKLDDEQRAFNDFMLRLRRAKDQDEFDKFMADRNGGSQGGAA